MPTPAPVHPPLPRAVSVPGLIILLLSLLLLIAQLVAQPVAKHYTQEGLDQMKGYRGAFSHVSVNLFTGTYTVHDLEIVQDPPVDQKEPLATIQTLRARLLMRKLLRFQLIGVAHVGKLKLTWAYTPHHVAELERLTRELNEKLPPFEQIDEALRRVVPFKVGRVELQRSELVLIDGESRGRPKVWLHEIEAALENFATRARLANHAPTTLALSAKVQHTGALTLFLTVDALSEVPRFAGEAELLHLQLRDLFDLIAARTGLHIPRGVLDLHVRFKSERGHITGGVRPLLRHADVEPVAKDFKKRLEAGLADAALHVFADRPHGRDAVGTTIPIEGTVRHADVQIVPTVVGVLRNAFVEGVSDSFARLPPPTAEKKEGVVRQAIHGLEKEAGPPKAQPEDEPKEKP